MFVLDIPVTQMYVPGTLNDVEHVLVDVGTGYYVEKVKKKNNNLQFEKPWMDYNETKCLNVFELCWDFSFMSLQNVEDSKAFFKRKIDFLTKQIEKIQPALQEKHAMKQGNFLISVHHHTMWHYTGFKHCMSQNSGWVGGGWNTYFIQWHACFWTFYFFLQLKWNYPKN